MITAMRIQKYIAKTFSSRTGSPMILKLGVQHLGPKLYQVYINGYPAMKLTYFTSRSYLLLMHLNVIFVKKLIFL